MISPGSQWHRWEPHIYAPGTVLDDRFGGGDPWDVYLTRIEAKTPLLRALAVTDYYLTELYEQVLQHKEDGRLAELLSKVGDGGFQAARSIGFSPSLNLTPSTISARR